MKKLAAVLGCGPAGLIAAHACESFGVPFVVFSKKQKSHLGGAQFSHVPIPGYHESDSPEAVLEYIIRGEPDMYRKKVYGETQVPFVSMEGLPDGKRVPAWNLLKLYDHLWEDYAHKVVNVDIDAEFASSLQGSVFSHIFSSVPAPAICLEALGPIEEDSHWFRQQAIRILPEALDETLTDNTILYDGTQEHSYYRMSKLFGAGGTEWGMSAPTPPMKSIKVVSKPIATNCDCNPEIIRIGRFGTWQKGVLTHTAWNTVIDIMEEG